MFSSAPLLLSLLFVSLHLFPAAASGGVKVTHLPGFPGPLPFDLETGYESVEDAELFYYFFRSERNPSEDPLLFWLVGGPGCSGISGFALEKIGPVMFVQKQYNGNIPSLMYNPHSWTKVASIIFIDSPVGTGFSFSKFAEAYVAADSITIRHLYKFLIEWYQHHRDFQSNPLYIGGDSYGGKLAPILADEIIAGYEIPFFQNLKGYAVGNPVTDELIDKTSQVAFANRIGMISDEMYEVINENCQQEDYWNPNPQNEPCYGAMSKVKQYAAEINQYYILDRSVASCPLACKEPHITNKDRRRSLVQGSKENLNHPPVPDVHCSNYVHYLAYQWANDNRTRKALHVKKDTVREWVKCNGTILVCHKNDIPGSIKYHQKVMQKGYKVLVYSGDFDYGIPYIGTHAWIRSLNFPIIDDWRPWHVDKEVSGYTRKFAKDITFATVKNAGHTAPEYQPKNCMSMFERWISHKPL